MNAQKVFCEMCREYVDGIIKEKKLSGKIRGEEYHYKGKIATCSSCGSEVYIADINDENLRELYKTYRKKNGIISLEKIKSLPEKYGIGKRPLSLLLGWGEHTFTRYCEGDMPSRQYSEILTRLYDDPHYYLKLLEANKERLTSERTYLKSKEMVERLLKCTVGTGSKIDDAIAYILNRCEDITPLALQKSLYYVQGFYYAFFKEFLFEEDCQAWAHGPVYRDVYARYADYKFDPITKVESFDSSIFSTKEKAVLDGVIKSICCYSGKILELFTHNETPWIDTRGDLPDGSPSDRIITKELIGEYFVRIKSKYNMETPGDIKKYSDDMFLML